MIKLLNKLKYLLFLFGFIRRINASLTSYDASSPTILITNKLPLSADNVTIDPRLMPYVGNGHLASTIFNNAIFVNGLYNGQRGESHRARIPNFHNFNLVSPSGKFTTTQYVLDVKNGLFIEQLEDNLVTIERRIYAHQFYNRLLITQITVNRKPNANGNIVVKVDDQRNYTSDDFNFDPIVSQDNYKVLRGKTKFVEFPEFQSDVRSVYVYFTPTQDITLDASQTNTTQMFISSIGINETAVSSEFKIAMDGIKSGSGDSLLQLHMKTFSSLWDIGRIETDNLEIQKTIYSSYYYMLSSLPAPSHNGQLNQFYGLSPGSLSRGSYLQDYQGHSFWDTEVWMFPAILMFYPDTAKRVLSYRISLKDAYTTNAKIFNTSGWRFPWESAYTGLDVTPDCCPEVKLYQIHINGDVAFAARQYYSATRNKDWLDNEGGYDLITKIAEYWQSRMTYNTTKQQYELLGVLPPDEDAQPNVNNSVYTNIIASLSIHYADYTTCIANKAPLERSWLKKARCLYLPFDQQKSFHPEYEGYVDKEIKQADVVLIGFPLMWPMKSEIRRNDLLFYENKTRINGPAMTWGMHAIGFIELGDYDKAADLLHRSYSRYVKQPFNTWTEAYQDVGAVNFITGAGGFLQTLIFGYGGLRLHVEDLRFNGKIPLLPNSTFLYLHQIKYLGASLSFNYTSDTIKVMVNSLGDHQLQLISKDKTYDLKSGNAISLPKTDYDYKIVSKDSTGCSPPMDAIDMPICTSASASNTQYIYYSLPIFFTLFQFLINTIL